MDDGHDCRASSLSLALRELERSRKSEILGNTSPPAVGAEEDREARLTGGLPRTAQKVYGFEGCGLGDQG